MVDAHTVATFAFAQLRRDPEFRVRFPWVRNTVVCVESDSASDVLEGMSKHYFPDGATIACYYPAEHRMMFIMADGPKPATDRSTEADFADNRFGTLTVGMLVDAIYAGSHDWDAIFTGERAEVSTAAVEIGLALA